MADLKSFTVHPHSGEPFPITAKGRDRWALERLAAAGPLGITPREEPTGPRWSAYIYNLRALGVPIETRHEPHGGEFPGSHARYVLWATATPLGAEESA